MIGGNIFGYLGFVGWKVCLSYCVWEPLISILSHVII